MVSPDFTVIITFQHRQALASSVDTLAALCYLFHMIFTRLLNLEYQPYAESLDLMRGLAEAKRFADLPEILMLVEHEPVLTLGYRAQTDDILIPEDTLRAMHIGVHRVERGGLVTYHGPGQLMAYPVFNLRALKLGVAKFISLLEEVIISTLSYFGLHAARKAKHPGNPCGINGVRMTSMTRLLDSRIDPAMVRERIIYHFERIFNLNLNPWPLTIAKQAGKTNDSKNPQTALA
ncbi:MAG: hypothetical protein JRI85_05865 [Deltaproteobacteria bacterium]|nr:hypothetical protein [Deltaproteobacteria bacterium]